MTPVSDNNFDHQAPRTGNLEELFRQKFAEAELRPRADVWEQLDHELLLRENQGYRRRLVGYRRVAAAACAVATLSFGGWLTQRQLSSTGAETVAAVDLSAFRPAGQAVVERQAAGNPAAATRPEFVNGSAQAAQSTTAADVAARPAALGGRARTTAELAPAGATRVDAATRPAEAGFGRRALAALKQSFGPAQSVAQPPLPGATPLRRQAAGGAGQGEAATSLAQVSDNGAEAATAAQWTATALQPLDARLLRGALAAARPDSLKPALGGAPMLLATNTGTAQDANQQAAEVPSRWRWRGGYSAQRFVPNVSSAAGSGITLADAAFRYANNMAPPVAEPTRLQPGLGHRGYLGAAVPLRNQHWTLLTGAELTMISGNTGAEPESRSAPSALANQKTQRGRYRFATVGLPVQLRYEGRKQGWGVYAAMGAAVNVLLGSHTEVGGHTATDDAAYRRVLTAARGGAGVRYAATGGRWVLNVGPEAELTLNTLNTNPVENRAERTRPYALGLAASVEFGGTKPEAVH